MINVYSPSGWVFSSNYSANQSSVSGAIQWNGNTKRLEVSTGTGWTPIDNMVSLDFTTEFKEALVWSMNKMREEKELEQLAKENPTIKDLVDQINTTKDKINMVKALIKKEDTGVGENQTSQPQSRTTP